MRALRISLYAAINAPPVTSVVLESDLNCSVEAACESALEYGRNNGVFVAFEIFEVLNDADVTLVTMQTLNRHRSSTFDDERNQAVLYLWNAQALRQLNPGGVLSATRPAPLNAAQIESVFRQLQHHVYYKDQKMISIASNGDLVIFKNGEVTVEKSV